MTTVNKIVDQYTNITIKKGDEGSELMAKLTAPSLAFNEYMRVIESGMNGINVIEVPEDKYVVVHSSGGKADEWDMERYAASVIDSLVRDALKVDSTPIAIADVVDGRTHSKDVLRRIVDGLMPRVEQYNIAIPNGEFAILGNRVLPEANISGTAISFADKRTTKLKPGLNRKNGTTYYVFDPEGHFVYINSDGVGTKTEFYERSGKWERALFDSLAMKGDDSLKIGAIPIVFSDVVETKGVVPFNKIRKFAEEILSKMYNMSYILQHEKLDDRIMGYSRNSPSYNISGSSVCIIDMETLQNPLKPKAGEYLIAIKGKNNPRSNGITDKREFMTEHLGKEWHKSKEGIWFLDYLATPSTVLYPLFDELYKKGLASSVYHMSGGAYNGKLARPLAKHNLYAEIKNMFDPDIRELAFTALTPPEIAYGKFPMGNDGFITTSDPESAIRAINQFGLEARVVAQIKEAKGGKTGVEITPYRGKKIYFSGKPEKE